MKDKEAVERDYCWSLDERVIGGIASGASTFEELLAFLPGAYPSIVLEAVRRLSASGEMPIAEFCADTLGRSQPPVLMDNRRHEIVLPTPHPLDYEWRFSAATIDYVLETIGRSTKENDAVALLGAPSLMRAGLERSYPRHLFLLDANPALGASFSGYPGVIVCDLLADTIPEIEVAAVMADPPWYEEHIQAFLWAASRICQTQCRVFLSLPPIGTRPGIEQERVALLGWARTLGLELDYMESASLTYVSPPFEANSLLAEGLTAVPRDWRRGDLFVFVLRRRHDVARPIDTIREDVWDEVTLEGVRIRVMHSGERAFGDPCPISVIPGDVLPSVSRRDCRRALAAVWTSGNRIFGCEGKSILRHILRAIAAGASPELEVASFLGRDLAPSERSLIQKATDQIIELVRVEQEEYAHHEALGH